MQRKIQANLGTCNSTISFFSFLWKGFKGAFIEFSRHTNSNENLSSHYYCHLTMELVSILIQVDDEKVVSGSYDKTLKVWDIKTGDCKLTLR